jgi:hypothetical protein
MMEVAPYATDHDDDGKRIASNYCYDLPNHQEDDDDVSFVPFSLLILFENTENRLDD